MILKILVITPVNPPIRPMTFKGDYVFLSCVSILGCNLLTNTATFTGLRTFELGLILPSYASCLPNDHFSKGSEQDSVK